MIRLISTACICILHHFSFVFRKSKQLLFQAYGPCNTVCLFLLIEFTTHTYHPQKAISIEGPLLHPSMPSCFRMSSLEVNDGFCDVFVWEKQMKIWRPKLPPKSQKKDVTKSACIYVDPGPSCFFADNGRRRPDSLRHSIFGFSGLVFVNLYGPCGTPWDVPTAD